MTAGNRLKDKLRPEDMVIVESFSRLGRSMKDLIELVAYFEEREIKLLSIKENFDTSTPRDSPTVNIGHALVLCPFFLNVVNPHFSDGTPTRRGYAIYL